MFTRRQFVSGLLLAPLAVALGAPEAAHGGTYRVFSCKGPSGRPAPTDGWSAVQQGGAFSAPSNDCARGGGMDGRLNGDFAQPSGTRLGWSFSVPQGLDLVGFRMWRSFATTPAAEVNATPYAYVSWPTADFSPDAHDFCAASDGCQRTGWSTNSPLADDLLSVRGLDDSVRRVFVLAGCGGSAGCVDRNSSTPMARATVKAFEAQLRDTTAPRAANVHGPLATNAVHSGIESLAYDAADTGSGVYRSTVEIRREGSMTWETLGTQPVDVNDGACVDANPATPDPYEFLRRVPCKSQAGGSLTLDTRVIPNGAHELRVSLEDASGNRATVLGPTRLAVTNDASTPGGGILGLPTNGVGASNTVRIVLSSRSRAPRTLRFGQRYKLIATVRNEQGQPVRGAQVDVLQRIKLPGATWTVARKPVVTGSRGQVRWTVPAGPSRRLQLAYRANLLNASYQATTEVPLAVEASTTLKRDRRSYRNGQLIRFSGRLRSKPIPAKGVMVDLQAFKRKAGWVTFATRRSSRTGRWGIRYRLTSTTRRTTYRFRARVREDSAYPYAASTTKPIKVPVRP